MLRLVASGSGASRPLVFVVHAAAGSKGRPSFVDERIRAAVGPSACVVNCTAPVPEGKGTTGGAYRAIGARASDGSAFPSLSEVEAWAAAHGGGAGGPVVVVGFSEGCQGVRAWLNEPIAGLLAVDGVHASNPPDVGSQIAPWGPIGVRARAGDLPACFTYSQIDPGSFLSVRETLRRALDVEPLPPGIGTEIGALRVVSGPGADAAAHGRQLQEMLPIELSALCRRLGFGGDPAAVAALIPGAKCKPSGSGDACALEGPPVRSAWREQAAWAAAIGLLVLGPLAARQAPELPWVVKLRRVL